MPPDHNQQHQRRPHYHRGRRGNDRRGSERRPQPQQTDVAGRDQLDIEQIMREIRARVSERHGIDLTSQQIQELAARRLEAILDPRAIKPSLMDELRRAAGLPADVAPAEPEREEAITESALYASDNGLLRAFRKLLNPLLKLLVNPGAIVAALNGQARQMKDAAAREAEQRRRQTEWNALHFEILRRLVTDTARVEIDNQHLAHRIESLTARLDFNERRVRSFEQSQMQSRGGGRASEAPVVASSSVPTPREDTQSTEHGAAEGSPDPTRRRRRRRRGRRSGQPRDLGVGPAAVLSAAAPVDQIADGDEYADEDVAPEEELTDEAPAISAIADEPVFEPPLPAPFEPPSPDPAEPLHVVSSELEQEATVASEDTQAPAAAESVDTPDRVPPEQS
jgi:hypothetical protein